MPPKKRDYIPENRSIAKKRCKTSDLQSYDSDEFEERDNYCYVNVLPNPVDSGESDSSDSEEVGEYESDYESSEHEYGNFQPKHSYQKISANYDCSQKKLEEKHEYIWLNGEKSLNSEHLSYENEILLKAADEPSNGNLHSDEYVDGGSAPVSALCVLTAALRWPRRAWLAQASFGGRGRRSCTQAGVDGIEAPFLSASEFREPLRLNLDPLIPNFGGDTFLAGGSRFVNWLFRKKIW
ncbi:hypothetical protein TSAR_007199 [Trichomalopsis sarcophagae]|uniref:Uncharacterized protein n=1 Tax=Trichomalopsis sarcophagae TaxID=543379 RepID=A0A232FLR8_9HYME|nr:hypothetical protein TSAR_007199 [Trichomalopsis sarcophagae]